MIRVLRRRVANRDVGLAPREALEAHVGRGEHDQVGMPPAELSQVGQEDVVDEGVERGHAHRPGDARVLARDPPLDREGVLLHLPRVHGRGPRR